MKAQQRLSSISLMSDTSTVNTDADCGTTGVIIADKGELPLSVNDAPRTETEFEAFVQARVYNQSCSSIVTHRIWLGLAWTRM